MSRDAKPLFEWAKEIGDANINSRILAKILPTLMQEKVALSSEIIDNSARIEVSETLYNKIKESAQELLNSSFLEE